MGMTYGAITVAALVFIDGSGFVAKVDAQLATHDFVVVQISDC